MTTEERFDDIKHLTETTDLKRADALLASGWRLLKVLSKRDEYEYAEYVLGWPGSEPPQYPSERKLPTPRETMV